MAVQVVADGVWQVGTAQKDLQRFHGYYVHRGVTYNAYLVQGEGGKFTLIDTVRRETADEFIKNIESVTPLNTIEHVIVNHTEPDHSGALPLLLQKITPKLYATVAGAKLLNTMYGIEGVQVVSAATPLTLNGVQFAFCPTPMVHWPDNMVTFMPKAGILFSNDAFGQHYAADNLLDVACDVSVALQEAQHYFANIVMPFRAQAAKAADAALALNPSIVAPSHGVIWTEHLPQIAALYKTLCAAPSPQICTLAFDSMWGGTAALAEQKEKELKASYKTVHVFDLRKEHLSDVMAALAESSHLSLGSPTHYGHPTARVCTLLSELESLKPPIQSFDTFGTFAWGGGAIAQMNNMLLALTKK